MLIKWLRIKSGFRNLTGVYIFDNDLNNGTHYGDFIVLGETFLVFQDGTIFYLDDITYDWRRIDYRRFSEGYVLCIRYRDDYREKTKCFVVTSDIYEFDLPDLFVELHKRNPKIRFDKKDD